MRRKPVRRKPVWVAFDGVLHAYTSGWKGPANISDGPVPGAISWLMGMARHFSVTIYSRRAKATEGLWAMKKALMAWGVGQGFGRQEVDWMLARLHWDTDRSVTCLAIDTRAWQFNGEFPTIDEIQEFVPWEKRLPSTQPEKRVRARAHTKRAG
jgi:hypothetical protein